MTAVATAPPKAVLYLHYRDADDDTLGRVMGPTMHGELLTVVEVARCTDDLDPQVLASVGQHVCVGLVYGVRCGVCWAVIDPRFATTDPNATTLGVPCLLGDGHTRRALCGEHR